MFLSMPPEEERGCLRTDLDQLPTEDEVFQFLEFLRTTGKTNMFGAAPYVEFYLDIPKADAEQCVRRWLIELPKLEAELTKLITD